MVKERKPKQVKQDAVPTPAASTAELVEQIDWSPSEGIARYVVTRSGLRVSEKEYSQSIDQRAIAERDFWQKVVTRYPDGTKIEIVQFDKKKHRTW